VLQLRNTEPLRQGAPLASATYQVVSWVAEFGIRIAIVANDVSLSKLLRQNYLAAAAIRPPGVTVIFDLLRDLRERLEAETLASVCTRILSPNYRTSVNDSSQWTPSVQREFAEPQCADWCLCIEGTGIANIFSGSVDLYWREDAVLLIEFLMTTARENIVSVVLWGPNQTVEVFR
jgi:hypothetical protein